MAGYLRGVQVYHWRYCPLSIDKNRIYAVGLNAGQDGNPMLGAVVNSDRTIMAVVVVFPRLHFGKIMAAVERSLDIL